MPTAVVIATVAFDLLLWRLPGIRRLHSRPRIYGTWKTLIEPHPDSAIPDDGTSGPIEAVTVIEQTFWTLSITLKTGESESVSRAESIAPEGASKTRKLLTYTYTNVPKIAVRHRSPIHAGASQLTIEGSQPDRLTGYYWTDRLTIGDLTLSR